MPDPLEQELAALTPIPPSSTLDPKIAHSLRTHPSKPNYQLPITNYQLPRPLSDKILLSTLSLAAAAALLILTLLTTDYLNTPAYSSPPLSAQASLAQTQQLLAQLTEDRTPLPFLHPTTQE